MVKYRVIAEEALDGLPPDDPRAVRSRRDLQRVHALMGIRKLLARALAPLFAQAQAQSRPLRLLELGAGDGSAMLGLAESKAAGGARVELTLLDRLPVIGADTIQRFAAAGWAARTCVADVHDWVAGRVAPGADTSADGDEHWDAIVATLFLHHLTRVELRRLLEAVAQRCDHVVAIEPRRGWFQLAASHCIGAIGANAVTRQDAVLSVHAGFAMTELTTSWPAAQRSAWTLNECPSGLFGHVLTAARVGTPPA